MAEILTVALGITVGVTVLLEVLKYTAKDKIPINFYPLISVCLGVVIALCTVFIPELQYDVSIPALAVAGAIAGLSASGFYDLAVKPVKENL